MFSKKEASKLRQEFWTAFGLYLSPLLSSEGEKINWLNYKTGVRHVAFRMQADNRKASIAVELSHTDPLIREIYFEQFVAVRRIMTSILREEWTWLLHTTDDSGKTLSRIYTELTPVNIYVRDEWPALISFFKPRIIALDEFWNQVKYGFETLQ
jgi:hypothetical protein